MQNEIQNPKHAKRRNTIYNPLIGKKLAISDCSQITDGAAAVILVSNSYLKKNKSKLNKNSHYSQITGWGHRTAPVLFSKKIKESYKLSYILPWTRQAVLDALAIAKLTENQIDCYETHDCFTSSEYASISAFGITAPGKEYRDIQLGQPE
jgi:acetyl-CoA C-acetyltransferase